MITSSKIYDICPQFLHAALSAATFMDEGRYDRNGKEGLNYFSHRIHVVKKKEKAWLVIDRPVT